MFCSSVDVAKSQRAASKINPDAEQAQNHLHDQDEEEVFQFLSGLDTSYSRSTRGHVLKRYQKQRREEAKRRKLMPSEFPGSVRSDFSAKCWRTRQSSHQPVKVSLQSGLSAHRSDPFNTLALALTSREQFLADHYVNVLIPQFYAGSPRDPFNINKLALFPNASRDAAAFAGALTFATHHLALLQNRGLDKEFFDLQSKSIRFLNARISDPAQRISDVTIYAVLAQVAMGTEFDEWSGKAVSRIELSSHIRGLRVLLRARGGMVAFKGNQWLDWILNWIDLESAGEISAGLTSSKQLTLTMSEVKPPPLNDRILPSAEAFRNNDLLPLIEELALLYENWYDLARRRTETKSSALFKQNQLKRRLFADRSIPGRQPKLVRLAILIQLNLLVWDHHRLGSKEITDYLESIIHIVSSEETGFAGSTTHFLWTLITDRATAGMKNHERLWTTTRMLRILDRCNSGLRRRLESTLLCFLASEEPSLIWLSWSPVRFALDLSKDFSQRSFVE